MSPNAKSIIEIQYKAWMIFVKDGKYLQRLAKIIDKKIRDIKENNFMGTDHKVKLRALHVGVMEVKIQRAKYIGQDISHNKDAIWMQNQLHKSWADLDQYLDVLDRIVGEMTKEKDRGGFLSKDFDAEFIMLSITCGNLHIRESKKLKESVWD